MAIYEIYGQVRVWLIRGKSSKRRRWFCRNEVATRDAREQHLLFRAANKQPHEDNLRRLSQFPSPPRVVFPYFSAQPETRRKVSILLSPPGCREDNANFPWGFTPSSGKGRSSGVCGDPSRGAPHAFWGKKPQLPAPPPPAPRCREPPPPSGQWKKGVVGGKASGKFVPRGVVATHRHGPAGCPG